MSDHPGTEPIGLKMYELYCGKAGPGSLSHPEFKTSTYDKFIAFFERVPLPSYDFGLGPPVADKHGGTIASGPSISLLDLEAVDALRCKLCGGYMMKRPLS